MDQEVISIGGSSSDDTLLRAFDNESSSSKRVRASVEQVGVLLALVEGHDISLLLGSLSQLL